jgi:hypothetical protein
VITLDTSGLLAVANQREPLHTVARGELARDGGPWVIPAGILGEIGYLLWAQGKHDAFDAFLDDMEHGRFSLDCGDRDFPRIRELVSRYSNLPLGFADAAVVACAERNGGRVLTLDRRDFDVVAGEGTIAIVP